MTDTLIRPEIVEEEKFYCLSKIFLLFDKNHVGNWVQPAIMSYIDKKKAVLFCDGRRITKRSPMTEYYRCISAKDLEHILKVIVNDPSPGGTPAPRIEDFESAVYKYSVRGKNKTPWRKGYQFVKQEEQESYEE